MGLECENKYSVMQWAGAGSYLWIGAGTKKGVCVCVRTHVRGNLKIYISPKKATVTKLEVFKKALFSFPVLEIGKAPEA